MYTEKMLNKVFMVVTAVGLALWLSGCAEHEIQTTPVNLSGTISVPDGVAGDGKKVTVNLYYAWALTGVLRHPVEFISSFETGTGEYSHSFEYPFELDGAGLLVYAWIDLDGDGVHCTPTVRDDLTGMTVVADEGIPAADITADVMLDVPCAGPDWFYPPAAER